jgi:hypothetical protein
VEKKIKKKSKERKRQQQKSRKKDKKEVRGGSGGGQGGAGGVPRASWPIGWCACLHGPKYLLVLEYTNVPKYINTYNLLSETLFIVSFTGARLIIRRSEHRTKNRHSRHNVSRCFPQVSHEHFSSYCVLSFQSVLISDGHP